MNEPITCYACGDSIQDERNHVVTYENKEFCSYHFLCHTETFSRKFWGGHFSFRPLNGAFNAQLDRFRNFFIILFLILVVVVLWVAWEFTKAGSNPSSFGFGFGLGIALVFMFLAIRARKLRNQMQEYFKDKF